MERAIGRVMRVSNCWMQGKLDSETGVEDFGNRRKNLIQINLQMIELSYIETDEKRVEKY